jgi:hypothetical protein
VLVSIPVGVLLLLNLRRLRIGLITRPFLKSYRRLLPPMSPTEREALDAGTVWWDGELFSGGPRWQRLMSAQAPALTAAEQAFLDGPCETLCAMLDDWDITHRRGDMPPQVWAQVLARMAARTYIIDAARSVTDAKVLDIINVDDFAPHELGVGPGREHEAQLRPGTEMDPCMATEEM